MLSFPEMESLIGLVFTEILSFSQKNLSTLHNRIYFTGKLEEVVYPKVLVQRGVTPDNTTFLVQRPASQLSGHEIYPKVRYLYNMKNILIKKKIPENFEEDHFNDRRHFLCISYFYVNSKATIT